MLGEYVRRNHRHDDKPVEYGDCVGNGAMFRGLGYLLERTDPPVGGLVDLCRARGTSGINDLDPSVDGGGPIRSAWGILRNADLVWASARLG